MRWTLKNCVCNLLAVGVFLTYTSLQWLLSPRERLGSLDFSYSVITWTTESSLAPGRPNNQTSALANNSDIVSRSVYLYGCHNIHQIQIGEKIGQGVSKTTFLGYHGNRELVVKMVTPEAADIKNCLKHGSKVSLPDCKHFPVMKLMKEILMLQQLRHPNILRLLGYCLRGDATTMAEQHSQRLHRQGLIAVYEYGHKINSKQMLTWTIEQRLDFAWEVMSIFDYFENHHLGSLIFPDFKLDHFMLIDGSVRLIDVDDISNQEPPCSTDSSQPCGYNLPCREGQCKGTNAKKNLENFDKIISGKLLTTRDRRLQPVLYDLRYYIHSLKANAREIKDKIYELRQAL